jgi:hypothetical protein
MIFFLSDGKRKFLRKTSGGLDQAIHIYIYIFNSFGKMSSLYFFQPPFLVIFYRFPALFCIWQTKMMRAGKISSSWKVMGDDTT